MAETFVKFGFLSFGGTLFLAFRLTFLLFLCVLMKLRKKRLVRFLELFDVSL